MDTSGFCVVGYRTEGFAVARTVAVLQGGHPDVG